MPVGDLSIALEFFFFFASYTCETKVSGANGDREIFMFPVQLTTSRIGNLTRLIHILLYVMTIHKIAIVFQWQYLKMRADLLSFTGRARNSLDGAGDVSLRCR